MSKIVYILSFLSFSLSVTAGQKIVFLKQNSNPKYFTDKSEQVGLCDEIYFNIKKELSEGVENIDIDERLYPIKRILSMLKEGRGHVFCGAGRNEKREGMFIYSKLPVYHVSNVVAAKSSEKFIPKTVRDFVSRDIIVGAYHGTTSAKFIKKQKDIRLNDNFTSFNQAFKELNGTNLRYFYYHDLGLNYLVKESGLPLKVLPTKFRIVPQWIIYSKKIPPRVHAAIESAIQRLHDKRIIHKTWKKYLNK